jgi:hypothetical protein
MIKLNQYSFIRNNKINLFKKKKSKKNNKFFFFFYFLKNSIFNVNYIIYNIFIHIYFKNNFKSYLKINFL